MKVTIQIVVESDDSAEPVVQEVARLERGDLRLETLGLTLAEARALLEHVQRTLVEQQVAEHSERHRYCLDCGTLRTCKDHKEIVVRSPFGALRLPSSRLYACPCRARERRSLSPLAEALPERTTPELLYLEAKFAAQLSYGLTVDLLGEVLPIGATLSASTVRRHVHRVTERAEGELGEERPAFIDGCPRDWACLPRPAPPLVVGLDGGYVHSCEQTSRRDGWFEIIVGKSVPGEGPAKCFGFVRSHDTRPKRRLFELLKAQGMQMNQAVTFLSDGGDTVRDLPLYLNPQSEHILDWFHVTMRLTVMRQMVKGIRWPSTADSPGSAVGDLAGAEALVDMAAELPRRLERLKWYLWHGNVFQALQVIDDVEVDIGVAEESPEQRKLLKAVREFGRYIRANRAGIPNDGDRHRHGEAISSAVAESTVNQVISKRMVKQQQMRWSPRGAHLLLQVRIAVLNDDLRATFCRWYPGLAPAEPPTERRAA